MVEKTIYNYACKEILRQAAKTFVSTFKHLKALQNIKITAMFTITACLYNESMSNSSINDLFT